MKIITSMILAGAAALMMTACGEPAANTTANTSNANTTKPTAAAPTKDALLAMDKQANDAYFKGDSKFFETFLSDKYMSYNGGDPESKASVLKDIAGVKCNMTSFDLSDPQMSMVDADTYVLSYKGTFDGTCNDGPGGKEMKAPSPVRAATVFVRSGDKWQAASHSETPIIEAKSDAKDETSSADTKSGMKKGQPDDKMADAKKADDKMTDAKKADDKTADAKKGDDKMTASKVSTTTGAAKATDAAKKDATTANSNSAEPAKPTADGNTAALTELMKSGWDAWKAKDAKRFEDLAAPSLATVDAAGMWHGDKADTIKFWTTMDCTGVTKTDVKDGFAYALSPTVEIFMGVGSADGSCNGQKNGPLNNIAVFVKEGTAWKLAFLFESPKKS